MVLGAGFRVKGSGIWVGDAVVGLSTNRGPDILGPVLKCCGCCSYLNPKNM